MFLNFSKIVLKSFIHNKKLISCHSRQYQFDKKFLVVALMQLHSYLLFNEQLLAYHRFLKIYGIRYR